MKSLLTSINELMAWIIGAYLSILSSVVFAAPEPLTRSTLADVEETFLALFRDEAASGHLDILSDIGLKLVDQHDRWILTDTSKTGRGHYYFRKSAQDGTLLQAPHQFFDKHTGDIALRIFEESTAAALAINSISRKKHDGNARKFDLAHRDDTVFFAHTRAFMRYRPNGVILQLHGYAKAKRKSPEGRGSSIILSLGGPYPDQALEQSAACLARDYESVLTYPKQVRELGGTKNVISRMVKHYPRTRFVHVELSAPVRDRLLANQQARGHFYRCLAF